jgi:arsenate reductase
MNATPQRPPLNVLFLCTHNSARSILAEALLNAMGQGRFKAYSAGSSPRDNQQPHPLGLQALAHAGIPTEGLRSKSWDEFAAPGAPHMDLIITVCDNAAGEVCPFWPGHPATARTGVMPTRQRAMARTPTRLKPSARPCTPSSSAWNCW